jgi:hypothetical protein
VIALNSNKLVPFLPNPFLSGDSWISGVRRVAELSKPTYLPSFSMEYCRREFGRVWTNPTPPPHVEGDEPLAGLFPPTKKTQACSSPSDHHRELRPCFVIQRGTYPHNTRETPLPWDRDPRALGTQSSPA